MPATQIDITVQMNRNESSREGPACMRANRHKPEGKYSMQVNQLINHHSESDMGLEEQ